MSQAADVLVPEAASHDRLRLDTALRSIIDAEVDVTVAAVLKVWRPSGKLSATETHLQLVQLDAFADAPLSRVQRACSKATKAVAASSGLLEYLQQLKSSGESPRSKSWRVCLSEWDDAQQAALRSCALNKEYTRRYALDSSPGTGKLRAIFVFVDMKWARQLCREVLDTAWQEASLEEWAAAESEYACLLYTSPSPRDS